MGYGINSEMWWAALTFDSELISANPHFNIATNQSLNKKVPMFLHRGIVLRTLFAIFTDSFYHHLHMACRVTLR